MIRIRQEKYSTTHHKGTVTPHNDSTFWDDRYPTLVIHAVCGLRTSGGCEDNDTILRELNNPDRGDIAELIAEAHRQEAEIVYIHIDYPGTNRIWLAEMRETKKDETVEDVLQELYPEGYVDNDPHNEGHNTGSIEYP